LKLIDWRPTPSFIARTEEGSAPQPHSHPHPHRVLLLSCIPNTQGNPHIVTLKAPLRVPPWASVTWNGVNG